MSVNARRTCVKNTLTSFWQRRLLAIFGGRRPRIRTFTTIIILPRPWLQYNYFHNVAKTEEIVKAYGLQPSDRPRLRVMLREKHWTKLVFLNKQDLGFLTTAQKNAIHTDLESTKSSAGLFNQFQKASTVTVEISRIPELSETTRQIRECVNIRCFAFDVSVYKVN